MIIVTGSIVAKSSTFDEIFAASQAHVHRSRKEPGCVSHAVYQDPENPLRLVFVEEWDDRAALLTHFAVPASRIFAQMARTLAAEPPVLNIYDAALIAL